MGALFAGAQHRKQFEERLKAILKKVKESKNPIILFIDKIHTVLGAGANKEGAMDAENILKPILSRGEVHCIGAIILIEYKKCVEKDAACAKLFTQKNSQPEEIATWKEKTQLTVEKIAFERAKSDKKDLEFVADLK
ncbi:chaperone Clpb, putative [Entamoeba invadens IP1]|uniref:Chaperone Clpb, putative n=1 Tax=Entamoeba invadens IP1 TaxID=370355 RepID=L7FN11_ENTIV|nr:chaperone Clpb, putative [Entamoeba invadens IP1]ELP87168.1 chaperone Clpb, putative [Entamoeba invadens IP1]|eukprot:XP_004253939.1 chaperone Clpb, putative [Entamoeba invadens IP1]